MTYFHVQVSIVAMVTCCLLTTTSAQQNCKMDDFPVQANFNTSKFAGKWYEIKWILEPWIPVEWNFLDFFQDVALKGNDFDIFSLGRVSSSAKFCVPGTSALYDTGHNAKYIYNRKYNSTTRMNSTYWITDTDYDHYALTYGCRELADNGTCVQPDCWLWSRTPQLDDHYLNKMEAQLPGLCLSTDMLIVTKQEKECTEKETSPANTLVGSWTMLTTTLAAILWKTL